MVMPGNCSVSPLGPKVRQDGEGPGRGKQDKPAQPGPAQPGAAQPHTTLFHLGEELSFLEMLRWKMEGAKHTARLPAVIWFSSAEAMSLRKYSRVCSTSRFSSGSRKVAACAAANHCSLGRTANKEWQKGFLIPLEPLEASLPLPGAQKKQGSQGKPVGDKGSGGLWEVPGC